MTPHNAVEATILISAFSLFEVGLKKADCCTSRRVVYLAPWRLQLMAMKCGRLSTWVWQWREGKGEECMEGVCGGFARHIGT